ncbi:hypothetical protein G210_1934 [Candida maltosa Xu316]|uniref:Uncharacterized protein n=1 Tax=Candida maltosa (strain Xu316) TaxID=1245528 RepID=M3JZ15_CANMX|nr:hypothetical protein G210_1934 [Candida maltosa Xu316]
MKVLACFSVITLVSASASGILKKAALNKRAADCDYNTCARAGQVLIDKCPTDDPQCICDLSSSFFDDFYDCTAYCVGFDGLNIHSAGDFKNFYCAIAKESAYTYDPETTKRTSTKSTSSVKATTSASQDTTSSAKETTSASTDKATGGNSTTAKSSTKADDSSSSAGTGAVTVASLLGLIAAIFI